MIAHGIERLRDAVTRAHGGDAGAASAYQLALYHLHEDRDPGTAGARAFLAEIAYLAEAPFVELVPAAPTLSPDAFRARALEVQGEASKIVHPLTRRLFDGAPTRTDLEIYMTHQYFRARRFYRVVAELALRLELDASPLLYENLHEETGSAGKELPHPRLLYRLIDHLGLAVDDATVPGPTAAHAYLNNRYRSARQADPGWGLGLAFAIEHRTARLHARLYELLRRFDVPEEFCRFHHLHAHVDEVHADQLLELCVDRLTTAEAQRAFFSSLRRHHALTRSYFDEILREMQAAEAAGAA